MPSWTIHIKVARTINKKLKLDENSFLFGNVMPDVLSGFIVKETSTTISPAISHYRSPEGVHEIEIDKFINTYKGKFKNPVVLGYLIHLITDYFWNDWTYSKHYRQCYNKCFMIANGKETEIKWPIFRKYKHKDFEAFDNYLRSTQDLGALMEYNDNMYNFSKEIAEVPCTADDIYKTIQVINSIIEDSPTYSSNYKIFTESELNQLLEETSNYIFKILINNKIVNT